MVVLTILLLCILPTILSGFMLNKITNDNKNVKSYLFAFSIVIALISAGESVIGKGMVSILVIFIEMSFKYLLIYLVALIIVTLTIAYLLKRVFKEQVRSFIDWYLCFESAILLLSILFFTAINCWLLFISSLISAVIAVILILRKRPFEKDTVLSIIKNKPSIIVIVTSAFCLLVYYPNELYLSNYNDMQLKYPVFLGFTVLSFIVTAIVLFLLLLLQSNAVRKSILSIITAIIIASYVQGNFLNGAMQVMDGSRQEWSVTDKFINLGIYCVLIVAILCLLKFLDKKNNAVRISSYACLFISLMLAMSLVILFFSTDKHTKYYVNSNKEFELSNDNNVVVFILDWYDTQVIDGILKENSNFLEPLQDFTYYDNLSSMYAYTGLELPYLLTGKPYENGMSDSEYCKYAYADSSLIKDISELGYSVGIYTEARYIDETMYQYIENIDESAIQKILDKREYYNLCMNSSRYKIYPKIVKNFYFYDTGDFSNIETNGNVIGNDRHYYDKLISKGLKLNSDSKAFKFIHLKGAHPPFILDENIEECDETNVYAQGKAVMKIVYEYLQQMKDLGVYDSSTIIITADHGQNYNDGVEEYNRKEYLAEMGMGLTSNPILFVKEPYEQSKAGECTVLHTPLIQGDLIQTYMNACGATKEYGSGTCIKDVPEDLGRERYMEYVRYSDVPLNRYLINGYIKNYDNWSLCSQ